MFKLGWQLKYFYFNATGATTQFKLLSHSAIKNVQTLNFQKIILFCFFLRGEQIMIILV